MENNALAPVVVFAYKRVDKIATCMESLQSNICANSTSVYVYSDGARSDKDISGVDEVRAYLDSLESNHSFKSLTIIKQSENKGLAKSIIEGVTEIVNKYGKVIVVEDDLILSKSFLTYMNAALDFYADDMRYGSISGFTENLTGLKAYDKDIYVLKKGDCWGWATWKNRWDKADWNLSTFHTYIKDKAKRKEFSHLQYDLEDQLWWQYEGKSDTWAARWLYSMYINDMWTVYPARSLVYNNGLDGSGENCSTETNGADVVITDTVKQIKLEKLEPSSTFQQEIYEQSVPSREVQKKYEIARIKRKIRRFITR